MGFVIRNYSCLFSDNVTQPRILLNSTAGIGVLSLRNVSISNAGVYLCSAKNSLTNELKVQVRDDLSVMVTPARSFVDRFSLLKLLQNITVDVAIPPSFIKTPTNQVCPNGRTARFECQAQGLPVPRIYWLKDSLNITINGN